ncbi:Fe-Mn family superoxide dismutase [Symbiobacterium terraclitae]|uniref:superoxide dismutase n=1 Tax=Symbiobacterium terraclitae TaxID=557451 RepID=A0ABS4JRA3_9FIRM|nr:Fe-Mn family superoxide dismutase [Symbiobacterium terraclitae]
MFGFRNDDGASMLYRHVAEWARQARARIAAMEAGGWPAGALAEWQERFARLQADAEAMRTAPVALMAEAYAALDGLAQALTAGEPAAVAAGGEPQRLSPVPPGEHRLPPLPYPYDALEPYIDAETMRLHHDRHHRAYVEGLNRAERALAEARASGDFGLVKHWERELAFNGAGHYLHTLFWESMAPAGGGGPDRAVLAQMQQDFGGFDRFREQFSRAAESVEGGGWAIWVWSPRANRTEILTAEKHQNLSQWDVVPLLPLDVWEHAYYLKYRNDRAAYVENWWNVVNWPAVAERLRQASRLRWEPA